MHLPPEKLTPSFPPIPLKIVVLSSPPPFLKIWSEANMVKWKCLEFLYSSKGMCRIDIQLKKIIRLKYLILETPYTFFSIFSWFFSFTHLTLYHLCFQVLTTTTFPFLAFPTFPFVFLFSNFKKENIILNIFSID